jgi:predicted phosphodiesterase
MKQAIISDIHANLEALRAVLEDIDERGIEEIICCGDVVGYGPDPNECLGIVRSRNIKHAMGNHDYLVASEENFQYHIYKLNKRTQEMFRWTSSKLSQDEKDYLGSLPFLLEFDDFLVSHGSAADDEIRDFLYIEKPSTFFECSEKNFKKLEQEHKKILFYGHRHIPGIYPNKKTSITDRLKRDGKNQVIEIKFRVIPDMLYLVNVGSVGQPRDKDPRSTYAIYDGDFITLVKVEYDFRETQEKIRSIDLPETLKEFYARRLEVGK